MGRAGQREPVLGELEMVKACVFVLVVALWVLLASSTAGADGPIPLTEAGQLGAFYQEATGYSPNPAYFGAYSLVPSGESLYLGLGTARPAEEDGGLLARLDGDRLTALQALDEQGFVDMQLADGRLYIPGPDPAITDDWTLGNIYIHDLATGATSKLRNLVNVLHSWGLWREPGRLLVAVGRHLGDNATWAGGIFSSADEGATWTLDDDPLLGRYRTYDVAAGARGLVAVAADGYTEDCPVVIQPRGEDWQRTGQQVVCRTRLVSVRRDRVLALAAGGRGLVEPLTRRSLPFPGFTADTWAYNGLASDGRSVYVIGTGGRVLRSADLQTWAPVATFDQGLVSLAYWPERSALVVAERGAAGRLWLVPVGK